MRKIFALFLFSFLVFQFTCAEARTGPSDKAGYYAENNIADPNEWDFGRVRQGAVLKHDFTLKNETGGILKITGINTSCGCTASQAEKKSLASGESTVINVAFNSKGYSGAVKQFIYVNTDNAGLPVIRFVIKAEVIK
jgi:hypothetical protein